MRRVFLVLISNLVLSCSSSSSSQGGPGNNDAGGSPSDAAPEAAPGMVTDRGRILDFGTMKPLAGVTVKEGGATATTAADGKWSLQVAMNVPVAPTFTMDGYVVVHLPEEIYTGDNDRGDVPIPDLMTFQLAEYAEPGYDETKGSVSIDVRTMPSCASDDGATLTVNSPSGTSLEYFKGGFPTKTASAVTSGERPAITVYNIPPGSDLSLTLTHPTCKQVAFPVTIGNTTFTGKVTIEAGKANSALVVFLQ